MCEDLAELSCRSGRVRFGLWSLPLVVALRAVCAAADDRLLTAGQSFRCLTKADNDAASPNRDVAHGSTDDFPVNGLDRNNSHVD